MTDAKPLLRTEMKARRARFAAASPLAGDLLAEAAATALGRDVPWPDTNAIVAGYWPIQSEINPFPLMQVFEERGHRLALPCLVPDGDGFAMVFRRFRLGEPLIAGPFGIQEPDETAGIVRPDVVLLPLLAFSDRGQRLGYGGGYYDRAMARLRDEGPVTAYGIAFSGQQLADLPSEVHDEPLDAIFTDSGVIKVGRTQP